MGGERVVLVDENDVERGSVEKLRAHREALLHRAVSVLVFNRRGEMLLQRRADGKYHSGGLWSNTCCGHPRPGEATADAARRRLREEMGFDCPLVWDHAFRYRAPLGGGLTEHEFDHVFVGRSDGDPEPDPDEVQDWRWASFEALDRDAALSPHLYTRWFHILLKRLAGPTA